MDQQGMSATEQPTSEILTQLAALTALVQAQGEEIARLKATATMPAVAAQPVSDSAPSKLGRRGWLRTVAGATAAAALLTMSKQGPKAEASHDSTTPYSPQNVLHVHQQNLTTDDTLINMGPPTLSFVGQIAALHVKNTYPGPASTNPNISRLGILGEVVSTYR